ncbi:hypothetical protein ABFX02_10G157500 [Erythranthe guttata]
MNSTFIHFFLKPSKKNATKFKKKTRTIKRKRNTIIPSQPNDAVHAESEEIIIGADNHVTSESAEIIGANQDLLNIILSKIGDKHRHRCKIICKTWYEYISGRRYVYNFKLPPPSALLIRRYTRLRRPDNIVKYLTVPLVKNTAAAPPPPPPPSLEFLQSNRIKQSCNGLLLLCPADAHTRSKNTANVDHYVYNPTTGRRRHIPLPTAKNTKIEIKSMNLAFDPTKLPPHYKIVSLSTVHRTYLSYTRLHIYSSETHSWRPSKADLPSPKCISVDFSKGVYLNGKIHWPSPKGATSVYFDVENERFETMPMPPVQDSGALRRTIRYFGECGGRLIMIDSSEASPARFSVFEMKKDYSGWTVKYEARLGWLFGWRVEKYRILSVILDGESLEGDLAVVIYCPGRARSGKGLLTCNLRTESIKNIHSPVGGWDLKLLEEKGYSVVHPLFRTKFQV